MVLGVLVLTGASTTPLVLAADGQNAPTSGAVQVYVESGHEQEVANSILALREAASGRRFSPQLRESLTQKLLSLSSAALEAFHAAGGLGDIDRAVRSELTPQVFGDSAADLVFTPVTPCRIVNTVATGTPLAANTTRNVYVNGNTVGQFESQGGNPGGCGIPDTATAVAMNFIAVGPAGPGNFRAFPWAAAPVAPLASVINYSNLAGLNIANGVVQPVCNAATTACTFDLIVRADVAQSHLIIDVTGYFRSPNGLGTANGLIKAAAHINGTTVPATPTVTRSFNNLPGSPAVTVSRSGTAYVVDFGANIQNRFYTVVAGNPVTTTPPASFMDVTPRFDNANGLFIRAFNAAGTQIDTNFYVAVY